MESSTQGSRPRPRPRPRTQKKFQGHGQPFRGQTLSRPRTGMLETKDQGHKRKCSPKKMASKFFFQPISKKKQKKGLQINFLGDLKKKTIKKNFFQPIYKILTIQKIPLFSSRRQGNFRGLEASRPRPRLQNVTSRTSSRPRTSRRIPPLVSITIIQVIVAAQTLQFILFALIANAVFRSFDFLRGKFWIRIIAKNA